MDISTTAPDLHHLSIQTKLYEYIGKNEYSATWKIEFTAQVPHTVHYPAASWFQTRTMAMHRARPIIIKPILYSGRSGRNIQARANMSTGPTPSSGQWMHSGLFPAPSFCRVPRTLPGKGGYIIQIRPIAMEVRPVRSLQHQALWLPWDKQHRG